MNLIVADTPAILEAVYPVIRELRPNLTFADYTSLVAEAKARNEYELVAMFDSDKCVAAMGFRILYDFVHYKHLYIDDLVVTESCRSKGVGAELLKFAEQVAQERNCHGLRLCTGIDRKDSQRFYERNNWNARAIAYKKSLSEHA